MSNTSPNADPRVEAVAKAIAFDDGYLPEHYERCSEMHKAEWRDEAGRYLAAADAATESEAQ